MNAPARPAATDLAYSSIRARILSGDLPGGARLKEATLAAEMGLSRTPIREAIKRLTLEGFVESGDGYSTRVADSAHEEIDQIFEIRRRLECYAVERAAVLATEEEIDTVAAEVVKVVRRLRQISPVWEQLRAARGLSA